MFDGPEKGKIDLTRELRRKGNHFTSVTMELKGLITDKSPFFFKIKKRAIKSTDTVMRLWHKFGLKTHNKS
ncbi:hypothetical protein RRG08_007499 [Elysia crispata]|uniref:Uncharacterized protein n=1 Tax=Elysia crispata TaxID=231223 RepID=A0AAE0ZEL7_9GAST|nr:hypothetical protein RRG08_007499 [Elysia crispata]